MLLRFVLGTLPLWLVCSACQPGVKSTSHTFGDASTPVTPGSPVVVRENVRLFALYAYTSDATNEWVGWKTDHKDNMTGTVYRGDVVGRDWRSGNVLERGTALDVEQGETISGVTGRASASGVEWLSFLTSDGDEWSFGDDTSTADEFTVWIPPESVLVDIEVGMDTSAKSVRFVFKGEVNFSSAHLGGAGNNWVEAFVPTDVQHITQVDLTDGNVDGEFVYGIDLTWTGGIRDVHTGYSQVSTTNSLVLDAGERISLVEGYEQVKPSLMHLRHTTWHTTNQRNVSHGGPVSADIEGYFSVPTPPGMELSGMRTGQGSLINGFRMLYRCDPGVTICGIFYDKTTTVIDHDSCSTPGTIPDLWALSKLTNLRLENNQFVGTIPPVHHLASLTRLVLAENDLTGEIPDWRLLTELEWIHLANNDLSGTVPSLSTLKNLHTLILGQNRLGGTLPDMLGLWELVQVDVRGNQLAGPLPSFDGNHKLQNLLVSSNSFSGQLPTLSDLSSLEVFELAFNQFTGTLPTFTASTLLANLEANDNRMTGVIPNLAFHGLSVLFLANNNWDCPVTDYSGWARSSDTHVCPTDAPTATYSSPHTLPPSVPSTLSATSLATVVSTSTSTIASTDTESASATLLSTSLHTAVATDGESAGASSRATGVHTLPGTVAVSSLATPIPTSSDAPVATDSPSSSFTSVPTAAPTPASTCSQPSVVSLVVAPFGLQQRFTAHMKEYDVMIPHGQKNASAVTVQVDGGSCAEFLLRGIPMQSTSGGWQGEVAMENGGMWMVPLTVLSDGVVVSEYKLWFSVSPPLSYTNTDSVEIELVFRDVPLERAPTGLFDANWTQALFDEVALLTSGDGKITYPEQLSLTSLALDNHTCTVDQTECIPDSTQDYVTVVVVSTVSHSALPDATPPVEVSQRLLASVRDEQRVEASMVISLVSRDINVVYESPPQPVPPVTPEPSSDGGFKLWYLAPIAGGLLLLVVFLAIFHGMRRKLDRSEQMRHSAVLEM